MCTYAKVTYGSQCDDHEVEYYRFLCDKIRMDILRIIVWSKFIKKSNINYRF